MESPLLYSIATLAFVLLFFLDRKRNSNYPPRPPSLPIIGHLHLLKQPIHLSLQRLSNKYGPILSLSFGNRPVLLVSSPALAKECFTKNDITFANRPFLSSAKYFTYNHTVLVTAPHGDHWRNLRRIATIEILSTSRLNSFLSIRQSEVRMLLRRLYKISDGKFARVEMKSRLSELSFNVIMRMVAGKQYFGEEAEDAEEAKLYSRIVKEMFEIGGAGNLGDFLPVLKWIDFDGMEKRLREVEKESDEFCQVLVDEWRNKRCHLEGSGGTKTVIDTMLDLQESDPEGCSDDIIKGMIMTLLAGGTDTTAATMEWAMSLLLNHPQVLEKAKAEIGSVVGNGRLVEESDYPNLPYLQSIVNETHRLYPAGPLLLPHQNSADCTIGGYNVPKGTMLLVNAYAIHRDPKEWENATEFRPERFDGGEVDAYKLMTFGNGRRECPGAGLAQRVVGLAVGSLIQCFEWKRVGEEKVDMREGQGLSLPKVEALEAMCRVRHSMIKVLQTL